MASAQLIGLETMLRDFSQRRVERHGLPVPLQMQVLLSAGFADLPAPGQGATLQRWQMLAEVAAADLSLAKLFEGHTDALAILHELRADTNAVDGL